VIEKKRLTKGQVKFVDFVVCLDRRKKSKDALGV